MLPSAEHTFGQEKFASITSAPASAAHSAQRAKSSATSDSLGFSLGVATTDTIRIWPSPKPAFARRTSSRQTSGAMEGIPKQTAELTWRGSALGFWFTYTGPSSPVGSSTNTQFGSG